MLPTELNKKNGVLRKCSIKGTSIICIKNRLNAFRCQTFSNCFFHKLSYYLITSKLN